MVDIRLPDLHVGQGTHLGAVSVFPVWAAEPPVRGLATGRSAEVEVRELEHGPSVGRLDVRNTSAWPVLLLAGELFEGGWQHRSLVHDLVLSAGQRAVVQVSCVEQGRWRGSTRQVRLGRRATLRMYMAQTAPASSRQSEVWERVSAYDREFGASATGTYLHHLSRPAPEPMSVAVLDGQRGVIVGVAGQPAFLELFPTTRSLRAHLPALLQSLAVDAAGLPAEPTPERRARRFVARLSADPTTSGALDLDAEAAAGSGRSVLARSARFDLRGVAWDERLAHVRVVDLTHALTLAA